MVNTILKHPNRVVPYFRAASLRDQDQYSTIRRSASLISSCSKMHPKEFKQAPVSSLNSRPVLGWDGINAFITIDYRSSDAARASSSKPNLDRSLFFSVMFRTLTLLMKLGTILSCTFHMPKGKHQHNRICRIPDSLGRIFCLIVNLHLPGWDVMP